MAGEVLGVGANIRVIQQHQGLRCDRGRRPLAEADEGVRGVEDLHHRQDFAAFHCEIDATPLALFVERAGAERRGVERAADGEHGVADDLGFQAVARAAPEEAVIAIQAQFSVVQLRRLLVDGARHDELVDRLQMPAVGDQFGRQPVEQLGI